MIDNVSTWVTENWHAADYVLFAKRNLVIGLVFLNILKGTSGVSVHVTTTTVKLKKDCERIVL